MELEVSYTLDNEQQFWDELEEIVSAQCESHELIDNALRSYLAFTANFKGEYVRNEYDIARCSYRLLESVLYARNQDYVRRQIVFSVLQEDSPDTLHIIVAFLLLDGRRNESAFEMMNEEAAFPRLLDLIMEHKDDGMGLHRMLLELLYEMSRIQRIRIEDLVLIEDDFINYLFQLIEGVSDDVNDPYHSPVIRVLLILNEQFMVSAHDPSPDQAAQNQHATITNKVIKILSVHGSRYKTFGENIILMLNRESETSMQLLILKVLYLLFTSPPTHEYFYTNDLHVLLDIILRNLLDLPPSSTALRHTYLRVLYPLISHTQLKNPPHYKRNELLRLLAMMGGIAIGHFGAVDDTTKRLVARCAKVSWLQEDGSDSEPTSPVTNRTKQRLLSVGVPGAMESSLSVVEVAAQKSKPGVQTPSLGRRGRGKNGETLPAVPTAPKPDNAEKYMDEQASAVTALDSTPTETTSPTTATTTKVISPPSTAGPGIVVESSPFEVEGEA